MNADFDRKVISIAELVVADHRHEGTEHLEGPIEINAGFDRVGQPDLGIPSELKGATAVVALNIERTKIIIINVELLPDRSYSAANKRTKFHLARPSENAIDLNRHLNQLTVSRIMEAVSIGKCKVVLVNSIVSEACL